MSASTPVRPVNRLIDGLPRRERDRILARCEPVGLEFGAILCDAGEPIRHVYFPLTGFISLVATVKGRPPLEMGLVGGEGILGATLVLGVDVSALRGVVQGPGIALRMTTAQFRRELRNSPHLVRMLNRYVYVLMAQLSQTAACNRFHPVEARLARWLLMTHDRARGNEFHLTHQFLADMLGVRRGAVTVAAGALQKRRLTRYTHGRINIVSRKGLEAAACECYAAGLEDYARVLA